MFRGGNERECVLPSQLMTTGSEPEKRLLIALLEETRRDLRSNQESRLYRDASDWVAGSLRGAPIQFAEVCEWLGFGVEWLRRRLLEAVDGPRIVRHSHGKEGGSSRLLTRHRYRYPRLWRQRKAVR